MFGSGALMTEQPCAPDVEEPAVPEAPYEEPVPEPIAELADHIRRLEEKLDAFLELVGEPIERISQQPSVELAEQLADQLGRFDEKLEKRFDALGDLVGDCLHSLEGGDDGPGLHEKFDDQRALMDRLRGAQLKPSTVGTGMELRSRRSLFASGRAEVVPASEFASLQSSCFQRTCSPTRLSEVSCRQAAETARLSLEQPRRASQRSPRESEWKAAIAAFAHISTADSSSSAGRKLPPQVALASRNIAKRNGWARFMWQFLEDDTSSRGAAIYGRLSTFAIMAGTLLAVIDNLDEEAALFPLAFLLFEIPAVLEVLLRFCVCPNRHLFWLDLYNIVDIVAIFGSLGPRLFSMTGCLSVHLWRACRVFVPFLYSCRLVRRFENFQLLASAFWSAAQALPLLIYTLLMIAMLFAGAFWMVEPHSVISSVQESMWFTMLTIFTVSFGDVVPVTSAGKILTSALILISVLYTAIPIGIVGTAFSTVWADRSRLHAIRLLRRRLTSAGYTLRDLHDAFQSIDDDANGQLSLDEFKGFLELVSINLTDTVAFLVFESFDADGEGSIDFAELLLGVFPEQRLYLAALGRQNSNVTDW